MTFLTDVVKMGYSEDEIFAILNETEQDRKRRQILTKVTETVAAYRLREMEDLQALEKLVTWRRMNGFDRVPDGEDNWFHGPRLLPPTPQEFTESLWSEVNALKDATSMPRQKVRNLINETEQGKVSDEEFAILKRLVEKRGREAAQVIVTPVDTEQYSSPRPQTPEPSSDVCAILEGNEGKVGPERDELESPSAGTGFETPGQQCHPIWKTRRTTVDGFLTAGVGSNLWKHTSPTTERAGARAGTKITTTPADISPPTEHVGTRAGTAATPAKPRHKTTSEENKQFDPGGKEEKPPPWNAAVILSFFFLGGALGHERLVVFASYFLSLCACLSTLFLFFFFQVITFQRAEKHERRCGSSR